MRSRTYGVFPVPQKVAEGRLIPDQSAGTSAGGRGPSRSSLSSSDHGRSSQGRRSRSREPTPPQLRNFDIDDFTVVSHTTDSFTFFSLGMRAGDDGCRRRRSDGTRPGARDVAFPSSRSQLGMRAGDDSRRRRRSDGTRPGARDVTFPSSRSQLGMRAGDDGRRRRRSDGTRPGARDVAFPSSRSQLGIRVGDAEDETRGYERDKPLRSVLG